MRSIELDLLQVTSYKFIENWESNCPHYPEYRKEDKETLKDKKAQTKHRKQTKYIDRVKLEWSRQKSKPLNKACPLHRGQR